MLAQLTDPDSIAVLLDTFRPAETPTELPKAPVAPPEQPETLFGHYQSRKPEKAARNQHRRWTAADRSRAWGWYDTGADLEYIAQQLQRTPGGVKRQLDQMKGRP